ncbi:MAG TPA: hypothetical protein PKH32_05720 [Verrucomicrobiota bacterium]|nr:hypothetical protein [Verrucomicrobiota bacterium]
MIFVAQGDVEHTVADRLKRAFESFEFGVGAVDASGGTARHQETDVPFLPALLEVDEIVTARD